MKLQTREELILAGYPFGKAADGVPLGDPSMEWQRTKPDEILYLPEKTQNNDTDNCQLHVFPSPSGAELLALWTQSSVEGGGDNRLLLARSSDGCKWSLPGYIIGARHPGERQASWGFPAVTKRGRLYIFYLMETSAYDNNRQESGRMGCLYSDDDGHTFSPPGEVAMPRSKYDAIDSELDKNWVPYQDPITDKFGRLLAMCTLYTSHTLVQPRVNWVNEDTRACMIRFENLEEHPEPEQVRISWLPQNEEGITVANGLYADLSTAQEPSAVYLPDGRLLLVMRTMTGAIWWTVSEDEGISFASPRPLCAADGELVCQPLAPCILYQVKEGQYLLFYHNNPGKRLGFDQMDNRHPWQANAANYVRNPLYVSRCEFVSNSAQPLRVGPPHKLLDTGDVAVGPKATAESATYSSLSWWMGRLVLWYPDRKFYLLGKDVTNFAEALEPMANQTIDAKEDPLFYE